MAIKNTEPWGSRTMLIKIFGYLLRFNRPEITIDDATSGRSTIEISCVSCNEVRDTIENGGRERTLDSGECGMFQHISWFDYTTVKEAVAPCLDVSVVDRNEDTDDVSSERQSASPRIREESQQCH